jgi:hypothetical protein
VSIARVNDNPLEGFQLIVEPEGGSDLRERAYRAIEHGTGGPPFGSSNLRQDLRELFVGQYLDLGQFRRPSKP